MSAAVQEPTPEIRVVVVDDHAPARAAARAVIEASPGFALAGSATCGEDALTLLPSVDAHLVLMDVHMPGLDGIETARIIKKDHPELVVVLLSAGVSAAFGGATALRHVIVDKRLLSPGLLQLAWEQGRPGTADPPAR